VSIADFLTMTDIRFMDEITAPRRSLHPSATQQFTPARDASEIGLAECAVAMAVDLPQLELYAQVSDDLAAWIDRSKERYQQDEYEAAKVTPELFLEFMEADEAGKAELMVR
jgi:kinetochore protein Spc7/SPC105